MNGVLKLPPAMRILRVAAPGVGASVLRPEKGSFLAAMVAAPNADETTKFLRSMGRGSLGWEGAANCSDAEDVRQTALDKQPNGCILTRSMDDVFKALAD